MYHYVRPIRNSVDPNIKGLEVEGFKKQIEFFSKNFKFVTAEELIESVYENNPLPKNSIALTFDDGFNDHYSFVYPILKEKNIQGMFFPPAEPIIKKKILDVHKIHFILAQSKNENEIINEINDFIIKNQEKYNLEKTNNYFRKFAISNRFDIEIPSL